MTESAVEYLDAEMAEMISQAIRHRQTKNPNEPLDTSIKVVLYSFGDHRRVAHCIKGDWSGPKSYLDAAPSGLPLCPRCHSVCTEDSQGWGLALVPRP